MPCAIFGRSRATALIWIMPFWHPFKTTNSVSRPRHRRRRPCSVGPDFYIGANIGGAWSNNRWTDTVLLTDFNNGNNGVFIGGGQIGGNYQVGQFVIGGEWDFDWAVNNYSGCWEHCCHQQQSLDHDSGCPLRLGHRPLAALRQGWRRVGRLLRHQQHDGLVVHLGTLGLTNCNNSTGGWLVGAGFEYAFKPNWTVKAEYNYLGLGNRTFFIPAGTAFAPFSGDTFTTNNRNVQMVKVGFDYLFNWGAPAYSRY
jgi:outer membrane immunogenic protein